MKGILVFNSDRPDIAYKNGTMYGGLHCGDCLNCFVDGTWKVVRIEYVNDWVFYCDGKMSPIKYGSEVEKDYYRL
jgi:hypothetical protein